MGSRNAGERAEGTAVVVVCVHVCVCVSNEVSSCTYYAVGPERPARVIIEVWRLMGLSTLSLMWLARRTVSLLVLLENASRPMMVASLANLSKMNTT